MEASDDVCDTAKAPAVVLASLLRSVGASETAANDVAQRIVDRRYSDNAARPNTDLRSAVGATRVPATGQPFSDVRQLQLIPGMLPDWVAAIAPLTTVYGGETINPLTAPPDVIAALPGVRKGQVDAFLQARRSFPADVDRLMQFVGTAQRYLAVKPPRVASIELTAELANGYAVAARSVIVVLPQDSQPYRVLVWTPLPYQRFR